MIPTLLLTKTFGSRVADGVYESLLDGLELEKLWLMEKVKVLHYLMVDDKVYVVGLREVLPLSHHRHASHGLCG